MELSMYACGPFACFSDQPVGHSKISRIAFGCGEREDYINRKFNTEPTDELRLTELRLFQ